MKRVELSLAVLLAAACGGRIGAPHIQLFTAASPSIARGDHTDLVFAADPGTSLHIDQGVGDVTGKAAATVSPETTTTYTLTASRNGQSVTSSTTVAVGHGPAARLTIDGFNGEVGADSPTTLTVTVRDAFGNIVTDYAGTLHFVLTDAAAPLIADVTFTPAMRGSAEVPVTFFTGGEQSIVISALGNSALTTSTVANVKAGAAAGYSLSGLPSAAIAGEPLSLTILAVDRHGNLVLNYRGTAHVSSTDPTDRLPVDGGFVFGIRLVSLAFQTAGPHAVTVHEVGGSIAMTSSSVDVAADRAVELSVSGAATAAGATASTTVTARDTYGNTVRSYTGTVALSSSDAQAALPGSFTFASADAGRHTFSLTLKTAGAQTVTATDAANAISGTGGFTVFPGGATSCAVTGLPASAAAGAQLGLRVTLKDDFGNTATSYRGTVGLASTDSAAQLSAPAAYTDTDAGSRAFSAQLRTAGTQMVKATDSANAISCAGATAIVPGATLFSVTFLGADAWAGSAVAATVKAQDGFGNAVSSYSGTIAFSSSDANAVKPANATLTGSEGGTATVSVTFNTVGLQTLTATDTAIATATGTGTQTVHGLVYTDPPAGGKVRLIKNPTSTAGQVQLDLVSNATLFPLSGGGATVRNGVFAAGMNLPLDVAKVSAGAQLISTAAPAPSSAVLNLATGTATSPRAIGAALNTANAVLYSGVSQKRAASTATGTTLLGDAALRPFPGSASYYYSLTLRLVIGAAPGTVFDGTSLGAAFHAAVRDRSGTDVFQNADFAIGKLEVR